MSFKPSRHTKPEIFQFESGRAAYHYTPSGTRYTLEIFPHLDSTFPAVTCKTPTIDGRPASENRTGFRVWHGWQEIAGEVFAVVAIDEFGNRFSVHSFTPDGKPSASGQFSDIYDVGQAFRALLHQNHFEKYAKPLERSAMKSTVHPVREEDLTHTWSAQITACKPYYDAAGEVAAIRAAGIDPATFNFWKWAKVWPFDLFNHIIAEDAFGRWHVVSTLADGRTVSTSKFSNLLTAITTANESARRELEILFGK